MADTVDFNLKIAEMLKNAKPEEIVDVMVGTKPSMLRATNQQQQQQQQQRRPSQGSDVPENS